MAKLYTRTEWSKLMAKLPQEDRQPYEESPDVPVYTVRPTTAAPTEEPTTGTPRPTTTTTEEPKGTPTPKPTTTTTEKPVVTPTPTPGTTTTKKPSITPMSRAEFNYYQSRLPEEDRVTYEDYLRSLGVEVTDTGTTLAPTLATTAKPGEPTPTPTPTPTTTTTAAPSNNQPMSREEWEALQRKLPADERRSYDEYLKDFYGTTTIAPEPTPAPGDGTTPTPTPTTTTTLETTLAPTSETTSTSAAPGETTTTGLPGGTTTTGAPGGTTTTGLPTTTTTTPPVTTTKAPDDGAPGRRSAFALLREEFIKYGLGDLVGDVEALVTSGVNPAEFAIQLRNSPTYQKRFAGNKARIGKGLAALSEAEYIGLEDQYQNVMRRYGLPKAFYEPGQYGIQPLFEKLIAGDVSSVELEDRVQTAQNRVLYANPEVGIALRTFYPDITNGDVLAYVLDPEQGLSQIKRRITAAEIGSTAVQMGLATNVTDAEYLARYGVTKEQAQQGYRTAAEILPRGSFLGDIYAASGLGPYTQQTAEREIFNVPGAAEAAAQRRKLTELEQAQFSGRAGMGVLARERAGEF